MKRMKKALIGLAVGAAAALSVVGLAACGGNTEVLDGDYHYDSNGHTYGVKVEVTVNTDNDTIEKVEIAEHDYVEATDLDGQVPSWDDGANYNKEIGNLLKEFAGMTVAEVNAIEVPCNDAGQPDHTKADYGDLIIAGSTQSCGRLILAVQDALEKLDA